MKKMTVISSIRSIWRTPLGFEACLSLPSPWTLTNSLFFRGFATNGPNQPKIWLSSIESSPPNGSSSPAPRNSTTKKFIKSWRDKDKIYSMSTPFLQTKEKSPLPTTVILRRDIRSYPRKTKSTIVSWSPRSSRQTGRTWRKKGEGHLSRKLKQKRYVVKRHKTRRRSWLPSMRTKLKPTERTLRNISRKLWKNMG